MAYADRAGRARVNTYAPQAFGVCDSCGEWYNRINLKPQFEWRGDSLQDTGFRYCFRCLSKPQDQFRPIILPPDPIPIIDPRPEQTQAGLGGISGNLPYAPLNGNQNGFAQFIGPQGASIYSPVDAELDPTDPYAVAASVEASWKTGWGLPQPVVAGWFGTIAASGVSQLAVTANPNRTWLLIYNPYGGMLWAGQDVATIGVPPSVIATPNPLPNATTVTIGTGGALLQNGLLTPPATVWTGAIAVLGLVPGVPWWIWEGPGGHARPRFPRPWKFHVSRLVRVPLMTDTPTTFLVLDGSGAQLHLNASQTAANTITPLVSAADRWGRG